MLYLSPTPWRRGLIGALAALSLFALAPTAHAQEPACGPVEAVLYPIAPYYIANAQGGTGIDKDMFDEIARRSGCLLSYATDSRLRFWEQMRRGRPLVTLSTIATPERRALAEFVPYAHGHYYVMLRPGLGERLPGMAAFDADPHLRLLVIRGHAHGAALDAWVHELRTLGRVVEATDFKAAARMLRAGRGDALLALPMNWNEVYTAFEGADKPTTLDYTPGERPLAGLAMALTVPEPVRLRLRRALQSMVADGTVQQILRRHLGEPAARAATYAGE